MPQLSSHASENSVQSMSSPGRHLRRMMLFLIAVGFAIYALYIPLQEAFMANTVLNGLIVGVLTIGILLNVRQVMMLSPEVAWIGRFQKDRTKLMGSPPRLLSPLAKLASETGDRTNFRVSTVAARSLLDSIYTRLEEFRDISRYFIGLTIFLGLLGTFWGLMETVNSIGDVITGLSIEGEDMGAVFTDLKKGIKEPLNGMGTAFSSSLLGLAGSLVLGFLDLQAGQAQNQFYNELDDWLTGLTGRAAGGISGDSAMSAYAHALIEQAVDTLDEMRRLLALADDRHADTNKGLSELTTKMSGLSALNDTAKEHKAFARDSDQRLEHIDAGVTNINKAVERQHHELLRELRAEIKLLSRTLAAAAVNQNNNRNLGG